MQPQLTALVLTALIVFTGYSMIQPGVQLEWEEFSTARLEEALDEGQTVLVEFTADW